MIAQRNSAVDSMIDWVVVVDVVVPKTALRTSEARWEELNSLVGHC